MIKYLLFLALFYFVLRYVSRRFLASALNNKGNNAFNPFDSRSRRRQNMDQIEDAEFEDLTDKE